MQWNKNFILVSSDADDCIFFPSVSTEADEPLAAYLGVHMDVLYSHLEEEWDTRNKYFEPVKQLKLYFMPAAVLERCTES